MYLLDDYSGVTNHNNSTRSYTYTYGNGFNYPTGGGLGFMRSYGTGLGCGTSRMHPTDTEGGIFMVSDFGEGTGRGKGFGDHYAPSYGGRFSLDSPRKLDDYQHFKISG